MFASLESSVFSLGRPAFVCLCLIGLALLAGCGDDEAFCDSICNELASCSDQVGFGECVVACEDELDYASEVGGGACVAAREDYLDCSIADLCDGIGGAESTCLLGAIDGEIEACGEALGEF